MFMLPESRPIDQVMEDVTPTYLTDGILLNLQPTMTHKCVGKQLRPIARRTSDPVAPISELDARVVDKSAESEKGYYAEVKDAFLIQEMLSVFPRKNDLQFQRAKEKVSIFPRSNQYEYGTIKEAYVKSMPREKLKDVFVCGVKEEKNETLKRLDDEPCNDLRPPFWWKGAPQSDRRKLPLGYVEDYTFDREERPKCGGRAIARSRPSDEVRKGKEINRCSSAIMKNREAAGEVMFSCDCSPATYAKPPDHHCADVSCDVHQMLADRRWQRSYGINEFPKSDEKRNEELRKFTRPFRHDLSTWYATQKPAKSFPQIGRKGKRPMPEWRVSHL